MDTHVTLVGNVVNDPEPRTTQSGLVVTTFRLASTPRRYDRATGDYKDGETLFVSVSCWRNLARNVAASLRRGDSVIVTGRLTQRNYEKDGQRRSAFEVEAQSIGPDLSRGVARPERVPRQTSEPSGGEPASSKAEDAAPEGGAPATVEAEPTAA